MGAEQKIVRIYILPFSCLSYAMARLMLRTVYVNSGPQSNVHQESERTIESAPDCTHSTGNFMLAFTQTISDLELCYTDLKASRLKQGLYECTNEDDVAQSLWQVTQHRVLQGFG